MTSSCGNRFQVLCHDQVVRLNEVMEGKIPIYSRAPCCPAIILQLKDLVKAVRRELTLRNIEVKDVRLNGGAASYIIGDEISSLYNDIDLLFAVDLSTDSSTMHRIKSAVLDALVAFISDPIEEKYLQTTGLTMSTLKESYIQKLVRIYNPGMDCWSLVALGNPTSDSKTVELKFVDRIRRPFEFTVDSFQIILDSLLTFYDVAPQPIITEHFYPTVVAESVSGSFEEAQFHLNNKVIATRNPEEIRGGGLLKYCKLLVEGYQTQDPGEAANLERYMCSRFFIDFSDLHSQRQKLASYLYNHFPEQEEVQVAYLQTLHWVVSNSTICLMQHERSQSLGLIDHMIHRIISDLEARQSVVNLEAFNTDDWVLDQVFYGTSHFPPALCYNSGSGGGSTAESLSSSSMSTTPMDLTPTEPESKPFPTMATV